MSNFCIEKYLVAHVAKDGNMAEAVDRIVQETKISKDKASQLVSVFLKITEKETNAALNAGKGPKRLAQVTVIEGKQPKPKPTVKWPADKTIYTIPKDAEPTPIEPNKPPKDAKQLNLPVQGEATLQDVLATRVQEYVTDKPDPIVSYEQELVNTLFQVAREKLPEKGKSPPKDPFSTLKQAMQNRAEYETVYNEARALVDQKYENNPVAKGRVAQFVAEAFEKPYTEQQITRLSKVLLKDEGLTLGDIVTQHYTQRNTTVQGLVEKFVERAGMSTDTATALAKDVQEALNGHIAERRQKILDNMFISRPASVRKPLMDKIEGYVNAGVFDEHKYIQAMAEKMDLPRVKPEDVKELQTLATDLQGLKNLNARKVQIARIMAKLAEYEEVTAGRKLSTFTTMALLLNAKSPTRNLIGNVAFGITEAGVDLASVPVDAVLSVLTGRRQSTLPSLKLYLSTFGKAWKAAKTDLKYGINTAVTDTAASLPRGYTFKTGFLHNAETFLNAILRAPDRVFYEMSYRQSLLNQIKAHRASGSKLGPLRNHYEAYVAQAHYEAAYRTFQDDSLLSQVFVGLKRTLNLNDKVPVLGDAVLKFPKTPANLLQRGLDYSHFGFLTAAIKETAAPIFNMARGLEKVNGESLLHSLALYQNQLFTVGKLNQRNMVRSWVRATVGTASLTHMGYFLASLGILTGQNPDNNTWGKTAYSAGWRPNSINLSALNRFATTWNPIDAQMQQGDMLYSWDWLQPYAFSISIGVNQYLRSKKVESKNINESITEKGFRNLIAGINSASDMSLMTGIQQLFNAYDGIGAGIVDTFIGYPGMITGTLLRQATYAVDPTIRDTWDHNPAMRSWNLFVAGLPFLSKTLPARVDVLGEDMKRYTEQQNVFFEAFLNPFNASQIKSDPLMIELIKLYESTNSSEGLPPVIETKLQVKTKDEKGQLVTKDIELNGTQRSAAQKWVGQRINLVYRLVLEDTYFNQLKPAYKANVLSHIGKDVLELYKEDFHGHIASDSYTDLQIALLAKRMDKTKLHNYMKQVVKLSSVDALEKQQFQPIDIEVKQKERKAIQNAL